MINVSFEKIAIERANQGLTIAELAIKAGVHRYTVSRIERGDFKPRLDTVGKIAKALGKTIEDFKEN